MTTPAPGTPRILLVEDDEVIREATQLALERYGFPVETAADGLEGLERFRAAPPDLLLLDVMLPLLDGVGLCRRIREESRLPILMMSARTEPIDVISGLDAGAEAPELVDLPLGPLLARITVNTGTEVELRIESAATVTTDPRRLDRVVANLIANAHRHGRPPVLTTVDGTTVTVRDHGPGYPEEILHEGPQRFRTGARERGGGHGLGLTIAQGHATAIGARLTLANHPDGGALARLQLPGPD
ncbi:hybrid sensor histidine kinase/response regulator [Kitasatospora griseola]|uniref:hybrid sensor histidine kinase/response regulator n=1 Tax=Kitasatospora griseola TaxID=2064 RepID=UPI0038004247